MIRLGQKIRDIVTGLEGIAIGSTKYLNGCRQYLLKPPVDREGKDRDGCWIDEVQLEVVDDGIVGYLDRQLAETESPPPPPEADNVNVPGGPGPDEPLPNRNYRRE